MHISRAMLLGAALGGSMLATGCASIISDSNYPVTISSAPPGANFEVTNERGMVIHSGKTPATVTLEAGDGYFDGADYTVTFSQEGYLGATMPLNSNMDGWYVANLLFGGLIGLLVVDPATGAMWELPDMVSASMAEDATYARNDSGQMDGQLKAGAVMVNLEDLPPEVRAKLQAASTPAAGQ